MGFSDILSAATIGAAVTFFGNLVANRWRELNDVRARHELDLRNAYAEFSGHVEDARAVIRFWLLSRPHEAVDSAGWSERAKEQAFDLRKRLLGACSKLVLLEDDAELTRKADAVAHVFAGTLLQVALLGQACTTSPSELLTQIEAADQMFSALEWQVAEARARARACSTSWLPAIGARRFANRRRRSASEFFPPSINAMTAEAGPDTVAGPAAES